jgi:small subunit ribosomal protein S20
MDTSAGMLRGDPAASSTPVAAGLLEAGAATLRRRLMANIHSQKKRIVRAERERLENRRYTSTIKTYFRRLEAAVGAGDDASAAEEHRTLVRTIDKAVKRGALHRNSGARKKSRAARLLRREPSA